MLWTTLFNRLAKQPLRITAHNHVEAIIDGTHHQLTLKFDTSGKPYLVPMQARPKAKKPYECILHPALPQTSFTVGNRISVST